MESSEDLEFLTAGLKHYGTAVVTVDRFSQMALEQLERAIAAERQWHFWTPSTPDIRRGKAPSGPPWLAATRSGKVGDQSVDLTVGLWWRDDGLVVYTHPIGGPDWVRRQVRPVKSGIRLIGSSPYCYFVRTPSEPADIEGDAASLLEEFDDAIGRELARRGRPEQAAP